MSGGSPRRLLLTRGRLCPLARGLNNMDVSAVRSGRERGIRTEGEGESLVGVGCPSRGRGRHGGWRERWASGRAGLVASIPPCGPGPPPPSLISPSRSRCFLSQSRRAASLAREWAACPCTVLSPSSQPPRPSSPSWPPILDRTRPPRNNTPPSPSAASRRPQTSKQTRGDPSTPELSMSEEQPRVRPPSFRHSRPHRDDH